MSESSDKGASLEKLVTKILQKKLGARVQCDGRSGAGSHQKMDIKDWFEDTPLAVECKNHKTIRIKEWFRQAVSGASFRQMPTVVFQADDEVLATLRFSDLVDLIAERNQGRQEIQQLTAPIPLPDLSVAVSKRAEAGMKTCRNGHIVPSGSTKCLMKGCHFSAGYKHKREKK